MAVARHLSAGIGSSSAWRNRGDSALAIPHPVSRVIRPVLVPGQPSFRRPADRGVCTVTRLVARIQCSAHLCDRGVGSWTCRCSICRLCNPAQIGGIDERCPGALRGWTRLRCNAVGPLPAHVHVEPWVDQACPTQRLSSVTAVRERRSERWPRDFRSSSSPSLLDNLRVLHASRAGGLGSRFRAAPIVVGSSTPPSPLASAKPSTRCEVTAHIRVTAQRIAAEMSEARTPAEDVARLVARKFP